MHHSWRANATKNAELVEQLIRYNIVTSPRVANAMRSVDRGLYSKDLYAAYSDRPHSIGYSQTISAPHMHAWCLERLESVLKPGAHVLDVGSGSGYLTACMSEMVGEEGMVVGIDVVPELVTWSIENVRHDRPEFLDSGRIKLIAANGWEGWPEDAPYDAIHVGAAASTIPKPLVEQLKVGGKLVIPVGDFSQNMYVITKSEDGSLQREELMGVRYVPLINKAPSPSI